MEEQTYYLAYTRQCECKYLGVHYRQLTANTEEREGQWGNRILHSRL